MEVEQGGGGAVWVADSPHRSPAALSTGVSRHRLGGCNMEKWGERAALEDSRQDGKHARVKTVDVDKCLCVGVKKRDPALKTGAKA